MKQLYKKFQPLLILLMIALSFQSCLKDDCEETQTFIQVDPVYMTADEIRVDPIFESSRELVTTGKIYVYENYLMINEINEGIHIFNNSDPANPINQGFISIPGNVDISIRNDIMYADNYMDLLTIDISTLEEPRITCRDEEVFSQFWFDNVRDAYLVSWNETAQTLTLDCSDPNFGNGFFNQGGNIFVDVASDASGPETAGGSGNSTGVGGSLARFGIAKNHLYAIDQFLIHTFDLEDQTKPRRLEEVNVGFGIETLFPYNDHLFIGANDGLFIYDINTPGKPSFASKFTHARACDPVVVQDDIAYVTLRNGSRCQSFTNQLDIVDVSDVNNPELIISHDMENPHGLSVRDEKLFICEGLSGLKSFDKTELSDLDQLDHQEDIYAIDVISLAADHLIVIGPEGLYQYKVTEEGKMNEISVITTR